MESDIEGLVETFLAECEENLAAMEEGLVLLEEQPDDEELLHTIFRAAHTLKGNAASFGLERAAELAHLMEDLLERVRGGGQEADAALVTVLLRGVDALRREVPRAIRGEGHGPDADRSDVLSELRGFGRKPGGASRSRNTRKKPVRQAPAPGPEAVPSQRDAVAAADVRSRTLRVGIEKLDSLLNLSGELAIARGRLRAQLETGSSPEMRRALEAHCEAERIHAELQELVMAVRMVEVGPLFRHHVRAVRDQAAALGKRARLVLEGEDVEADTKIVEYMRDPLTHMLRNAIAHGIETPGERKGRGKDPCGTITLRARHEAGNVVFEVSDDGAGLDRAAIVERARRRGRITDEESLGDEQILALVLEPGFSTRGDVTTLSGRGVGLDVVRRQVESLRGALSVESEPGRGTTLRASVPLTVAIIQGFGVGVENDTYIVPLEWVVETIELPRDDRRWRGGQGRSLVELRGESLPCVRLATLFGHEGRPPQREHVLVVSCAGRRAGLAVDVLHGEIQTVIKPLGRLLHGLPGITGSAILGDGRVALILDAPALLREATRDALGDMGRLGCATSGPGAGGESRLDGR